MEKIKKASWSEKVMGLMNMSEVGQVGLFGDLVRKRYKKGIKERELLITRESDKRADELERDTDLLSELQADLTSASISVDPKKLTTVADRENYYSTFDSNLSRALQAVDDKEAEMKAKQASFDRLIQSYKDEIAIFETKLSFLTEE